MKTKWTQELTHSYPEQFEQLGEDRWIQRKDIKVHKLSDGTVDGYECQSRKLSQDVYEALQEEYDSPAYVAMEDANAQLLLQQAEIQETQAGQDDTLAEILITLMEG